MNIGGIIICMIFIVINASTAFIDAKVYNDFIKELTAKSEFTNNTSRAAGMQNAFNAFLAAHELVVIAFLSTDCRLCQKFESSGIFLHLEKVFPKVEFVIIRKNEADKEFLKIIQGRFNIVDGYPLFVIAKNGQHEPFKVIKGFDDNFKSILSSEIAKASVSAGK